MSRNGCANVVAEFAFALILTVCIGTMLWIGGLLGVNYLRGLIP